MEKMDLGIDKIVDRHGRCLGSRIELASAQTAWNANDLLVHAVNSLAGGPSKRQGKLFLPLNVCEADTQVVQSMAGLAKHLRKNVFVEAHASSGGLSAVAVTKLRGLRTMLRVNLALSSKGYSPKALMRDMKALDPEVVIVDSVRAATMIRTRQRQMLLDLEEVCRVKGARLAVEGDFCDGDQSWLIDGGADMFIGQRFGVRVAYPEGMCVAASRTVSGEIESGQLDGLMWRLGVHTAMNVD